MATNENQANARKAQDVDAPEHFQREAKGTYHWGRGGEGNKMTVGGGEKRSSTEEKRSNSFISRSKEKLGLKAKAKDGSAVSSDDESESLKK